MSKSANATAIAIKCMLGLALAILFQGRADAELSADSSVTLLWTERRPFQYTGDDGRARGILVDIGEKIFRRAGTSHAWEFAPGNRVINLLKFNDKALCAVGWYKSAEREAIAQFSEPVYRDRPLRGVFRAAAGVAPGMAAKTVFDDPKLRVLLRLGFAYGPTLDGLIAGASSDKIFRVSVEVPNQLLMLRANRADVVLLAQEEIDYYAKSDPTFKADFKVVEFSDLPEADHRFIMCSKVVSPKTMNKINAAIAATISLR